MCFNRREGQIDDATDIGKGAGGSGLKEVKGSDGVLCRDSNDDKFGRNGKGVDGNIGGSRFPQVG